jgi:hypothetical protein
MIRMDPHPTDVPPAFRLSTFWALFALGVLLVYFFLPGHYRPYDLDDPWLLSLSYNYVNKGISTDLSFGDPGNGVQFYGKIHAYLIGIPLNALGWTRLNGEILSILFMLAALALWMAILQKSKFSRELSAAFALTALLLDPFFSSATSTRSEAFVFLLLSLSVLLFKNRYYFGSMLTTWFAIETHPIGILIFFYLAAVYASEPPEHKFLFQKPNRRTIFLLSGFTLGAACFYLLHADTLSGLAATLMEKNTPKNIPSYGPLFDYFFKTKYLRHLPELALFLAALMLFLKNRLYKTERFIWFLLLSTIVACFCVRRPNFHYAVFFFPAILLLILRTSQILGHLRTVIIFLAVLLLPQYGFVYWKNKDFDLQKGIQAVKTAVPADGLPIVGNSNEWYAFYDRSFYYQDYWTGLRNLGLKDFYLVQDGDPLEMNVLDKQWLESTHSTVLFASVTAGHQVFVIRKLTPRKVIPEAHSPVPEHRSDNRGNP